MQFHLPLFRMGMVLALAGHAVAVEAGEGDAYLRSIHPLLDEYCLGCHSTEKQKGDLDLERFDTLEAVTKDPAVWEKVAEQLALGEMPPAKKSQPSAGQKAELQKWLRGTLREMAKAHAGDPGPVVLRRLSNAEYTWTLRDLTGVASLDPAREFPVDGAAGEGFTNAGAALVMSPALVTKYLDAAKETAGHAVLLPDGIEFSPSTTRRDWTEEKLAAIREIYARHSVPGEDAQLNLQGVKFGNQDGGVLPLEKYFAATLAEKDALKAGARTIEEIARERGLSSKYLGTLWAALNGADASFPLDGIREQWRGATPADAPALAASVKQWQRALWRFNSIGHIGKRDGPKSWQEPLIPVVTSQEVRLKLAPDAVLSLASSAVGGSDESDKVLWENPRILRGTLPPIPLQEAVLLEKRVGEMMAAELARTPAYLDALAEAHATGAPIETLAAKDGLNGGLLAKWAALAAIGRSETPVVAGHFTEKLSDIAGNPAVRGWGSPQTPSIIANSSAETLRFSTLTVPGRSVMVHPSPSQEVAVYWRSPFGGKIRVAGMVADGDGNCGNGIAWRVELIGRGGPTGIAVGLMDNGGSASFAPSREFTVQAGDLVMLAINPRDGQHTCDTTQIDLKMTEAGGAGRVWDLASEVVDRIHEGNPLADTYGNADTWHFCSSLEQPAAPAPVPDGSVFAAWRDAVTGGKRKEVLHAAALAVQALLVARDAPHDPVNAGLRQTLLDWDGPLGWLGMSLSGDKPSNMEAPASSALGFSLPAQLAEGAEFLATARLPQGKGAVQVHALLAKPSGGDKAPNSADAPILIGENSPVKPRITAELDSFRALFPAALCYTKIVPVDEAVTLRLFYREDDQLQRLSLDGRETAELDRLWSELQFVSLAPLRLVDVFDQLWQFATQDADPSAFEPMREPIKAGASRFRDELVAAEPRQLEAVIAFAAKAWRRPLQDNEADKLRALYRELRKDGLEHEDGIRMTLARVLTAPAFLYKRENAEPGEKATPVNDYELATRLSYFLWSTAPDDELMALAGGGKLREPAVLEQQARRMSGDDRVRRLAIEFGTQWLHTRDLDQLDEKSERTFPEFMAIRAALNEEPIRFFTDLFQRDGSVLDLLDADHTFVNGALAKYYGFPSSGDDWHRVDGVREKGRGGVLGFGATLAKQSGASRTSPILRGNWVCETLLGEHLPPPPKGVPVLPEQPPADLTERALTERHSTDPSCAHCHVRMDPFGFALENFDAIGRWRTRDSSGLAIDSSAKTVDGAELSGIDGLRRYLLTQRGDDFERQFCRKLLGYALGRGVQLSDAPLLDAMQEQLAAKDHRIGVAIGLIVQSPQFREIRGLDHRNDS